MTMIILMAVIIVPMIAIVLFDEWAWEAGSDKPGEPPSSLA
jgi:hypothetical protein